MSIKVYDGPWGESQILHLLRRTLFGVTNEDYKIFSVLSLSQCIDVLLDTPFIPLPPVNAYNDNEGTDPFVPFGHTWINASSGNDMGEIDFKRSLSMKAWWVGAMLNQKPSLTEKMTLFWSNNLATQGNIVKDARYDYQYINLLRTHALGNFKTLTRRVTTSAAMLDYLNGSNNSVTAPNENYARELQELFTVGKGSDSHYTEADVEAAARILTGWTTTTKAEPAVIFNPDNHDSGDKRFSSFYQNTTIKGKIGAAGASETDDLIDMIFAQRETAKNLCRKLYRWFIYYIIDDDIEVSFIDPLADVLIDSKFEIGPVLRVLLGSDHFFNRIYKGCQIKNPVDMLIGLCRQFEVTFPENDNLTAQYQAWSTIVGHLKKLGMEPHEPYNVAGWPAYHQQPAYHELWINSNTLPLRNSITDQMAAHGLNVNSGFSLKLDLLKFTSQLTNPSNADQLIRDSTAFLNAVPIGNREMEYLKNILLSGQEHDHYWRDSWLSYSNDPEDEQKKSVVDGRLIRYYTYLLQRVEYQLI